ncbi:hypothetical protein RBWH47_01827 [Rhodopirellula baltica WH47]|uniref:Uncharacterized protein n=2 Tax=Rhodopirellula baltica TaxID=265606 RepID=F2ALK2_RHOBT|nr:hypothetical protein RBWH47_01827 [Rhodopirellula baltica WH47]ELP31723.1 hypothetical protein RBSWK_04229 [Rhodopirellula baltica SWK14]
MAQVAVLAGLIECKCPKIRVRAALPPVRKALVKRTRHDTTSHFGG